MSWKWLMLGGKVLWAHQCSLEAEWMCWNVRGTEFHGGEEQMTAATQQSPSQLLSGKTWRSKHRPQSLLDLASTFTGTGGREERTFAKLLQGLGDGEACVSHTRRASPAKQPGWRQMKGWERKGLHLLEPTSTLCSSLGGMSSRGSNLLHPALLKQVTGPAPSSCSPQLDSGTTQGLWLLVWEKSTELGARLLALLQLSADGLG